MEAIHFGAGNIGRGFIGEVLSDNGFKINFVDINHEIIDALNRAHEISILIADTDEYKKTITNVFGINSETDYEKVITSIRDSKIITTSVGPNNLKFIAKAIADGIKCRMKAGVFEKIDVIACENMIEGSTHLKEQVCSFLDDEAKVFLNKYIGFPNAAVDRIVPEFKTDNVLDVKVEPFKEWIIENKDKKSGITLEGVLYVDSLIPYIERKLFSVNTGHGTLAYMGLYYGYSDTISAISDVIIMTRLKHVLKETSSYLIKEYDFDVQAHELYISKVIDRFKNIKLNDDLNRVGRNPISKLGPNERFIKPLSELFNDNLSFDGLLRTTAMAFVVKVDGDIESERLQDLFDSRSIYETVKEVTGMENLELINLIVEEIEMLNTIVTNA